VNKLEEEARRFMQSHNKSMITADEYQRKAKATAIYPKKDALSYLVLGLTSEAGEVAGKAKKIIRDGTQSDLASEVGDVLWYCAMLATELNVSLGKLMENNLDKLYDRKKRGALQGSGDSR
jgi:NTP pyrophosphatase (non-canonical NTP hydrolase)|tara:strand:+ start:407 stop:769 length:363 start_codon:yes stop_codon:yes gene_type:complete